MYVSIYVYLDDTAFLILYEIHFRLDLPYLIAKRKELKDSKVASRGLVKSKRKQAIDSKEQPFLKDTYDETGTKNDEQA